MVDKPIDDTFPQEFRWFLFHKKRPQQRIAAPFREFWLAQAFTHSAPEE